MRSKTKAGRRVQQLIGGYVAFCVIVAGVIGISPALHQLIEHGGKGAAHTHFKSSIQRHTHDRKQMPLPYVGGYKSQTHKLRGHTHQQFILPLPRIDLSSVWRAISHFLEGNVSPSSESSPSGDDPGHHHDSLPQLLASGLIEYCLDFPRLEFFFAPPAFRCLIPDAPFLDFDWNPQTATRAPPVVLS